MLGQRVKMAFNGKANIHAGHLVHSTELKLQPENKNFDPKFTSEGWKGELEKHTDHRNCNSSDFEGWWSAGWQTFPFLKLYTNSFWQTNWTLLEDERKVDTENANILL